MLETNEHWFYYYLMNNFSLLPNSISFWLWRNLKILSFTSSHNYSRIRLF